MRADLPGSAGAGMTTVSTPQARTSTLMAGKRGLIMGVANDLYI
jgi:hypothetical protein